MKQGKDESLKAFMERFNRTARQVRNPDQRLIIGALTTAVRPGPFVDYLYDEEPQTMEELQPRLPCFIRIEEGRSYHQRHKEEAESSARAGREGRGDRRTFGRSEGRSGPRGGEPIRVP